MAGSSLAINVRNIFYERDRIAHQMNRDPQSIRILAVSKGFPLEMIQLAKTLGLNLFGENYVQEWQSKAEALQKVSLEWHFIGALQSNKVKQVVGQVAVIHSLDRDSLANEISKQAQALGLRQKVLVELNVAGEKGKAGVSVQEAQEKIRQWSELPGLNLGGLMLMPPFSTQAEDSRPYFKQARQWLIEWRPLQGAHDWNELSMGTSQDFPVAIAEGATLIRVGTALFGPRLKTQR